MSIKLGFNDITLALGSNEVDKAYLGSTLVYEKEQPQPTGETWVINDRPTLFFNTFSYDINFSSSGNNYTTFANKEASPMIPDEGLYYDNMFVCEKLGEPGASPWVAQDFRTVIFETAPSGNLLTWLQTNAVKQ